jgi:poly-gamma-glutamate synthesis protein (capsule biosynthesis protein)
MQRAGFTVMSCANNHISDNGRAGVLATLELLAAHGITSCGAGPTPTEARKPTILMRNGKRVGFLAYTAVRDQKTRASLPEIANVHAETWYTNVEPNQPGTPPLVSSRMSPADLRSVVDDVRSIRSKVDVLIVSFHWGIHLLPYVIADYERELACATIDAGADAIFGHHQHTLKPVEIYAGRPIFYGLGNFAFAEHADRSQASNDRQYKRYAEYMPRPRPGWSTPHHPVSRLRMIARCTFDAGAPQVELAPCMADRFERPIVFRAGTRTGKAVLKHLRDAHEIAGIPTVLRIDRSGRYIVPLGS